ncbi:unnamed protein product, partial [Symbiodinium pilosum]
VKALSIDQVDHVLSQPSISLAAGSTIYGDDESSENEDQDSVDDQLPKLLGARV